VTSATTFPFAGRLIEPGTRAHVELPAGKLPSGTSLSVPVEVIHGPVRGPVVWLSGAIHGDEIVGVEIIRQVAEHLDEAELSGTVVAVPVVNVFGFVAESRYLPDRRDLNRSFPGSKSGSLASQLARLFVETVVSVCDVGIDFHAGSDDRTNLPQVRGRMEDAETLRLARAFGAPLIVDSKPRKGTLRDTGVRRGKRVLLFEGGEPRRFSPRAVAVGSAGALRVLHALDMIASAPPPPDGPPLLAKSTTWVRAPQGGIFRLESRLGAEVEKGARLGVIAGPAGRHAVEVRAKASGLVMGHAVNPLVHRGDGLVHIARRDGEAG
jgi:predicted deacylase